MRRLGATADWRITLFANGEAHHALSLKVRGLWEAIENAGRSTLSIHFAKGAKLNPLKSSVATLEVEGRAFPVPIDPEHWLDRRTCHLCLEVAAIIKRVCDKHGLSVVGVNESWDATLRIDVNAIQYDAVAVSGFYNGCLRYEFQCWAQSIVSPVKVEVRIGEGLNWYRRKIAPLLAFPLYWSRRKYDIDPKPAGDLPDWWLDYLEGSARAVAAELREPSSRGPILWFRRVPIAGPLALPFRLLRLAWSHFVGTTE